MLGLGVALTNLLSKPYLNDIDRRRKIDYSEECKF